MNTELIKLQLEFMTRQEYPAAMIKSDPTNVVRRFIAGSGIYALVFYLNHKGQSSTVLRYPDNHLQPIL